MSMMANGLSMSLERGSESHGFFFSKEGRRIFIYTQYHYRHTDGRPFSCVAPTVEKARAKRDQWLRKTATLTN